MSLIEDMLRFANVGPNDLVLDSFAGSGTTAHAVLLLNKGDGGNRKFILLECEDYADTITAERVRRVIKGVPEAKDALSGRAWAALSPTAPWAPRLRPMRCSLGKTYRTTPDWLDSCFMLDFSSPLTTQC